MSTTEHQHFCRACGSEDLTLFRSSTIRNHLTSNDFAITDYDYGVTAALYDCQICGLRQCPDNSDVLTFYQNLQDPKYEEGRNERYLQAEKLVKDVLKRLGLVDGKGLALLDVGAGSGILLEAAQNNGFQADGIEPSTWLTKVATDRGLNVHEGVLPHPNVAKNYDVIMLIDVIEHVAQPRQLLANISAHLNKHGRTFIVTPDVSSFFARLMGFRWWHYRIAHISYFNKKTLTLTARGAGLAVRGFSRPSWYFSYPYLRERLLQYFPRWLLPPAKSVLRNLIVPLNLRDSLLMECEKNGSEDKK